MAITTTVTSASFIGTGVSSTYAPGFYVNSSNQVRVYVAGLLKTLGVDYVVNGVGLAAGCKIVGNFTLGAAVYIERATPITQLVDTQNNETILEDVLDAEFDKLTMIAQELDGEIARAPLMPKGEAGYQFPAAASRVNKVFGFDALGAAALLTLTGSVVSDAQAVSYKRTGAGTFSRTLTAKLDELPSIRDFGGVGGGVTDDSAADTAMRAAVKASGGGAMFYPAIAGGYKIGTRARSPGILIEEADFPAFFGQEPPGLLRVYSRNNGAGGTGESGITSFMVNGTGNMVPFSTIGGTDSVALSAVVYSGEDAPNPVCAVNIISRFAGLPPGINWGLEIDMNNESPTAYSAGDPRGGQGIVLNTGSTYSPDTGIVIQRGTGEGTGPGWKQGIGIKGARDVGILVQAMSSATAPGMSPAATGRIAALVVNVGGDAFNRFVLTESGQMFWSSGSSLEDVYLGRGGAGALNCSGVFGATQYWVGANAVVGGRRTGWTAPTGTLSRATFDQSTVTLPELAQRVAALITDLHGQAGGHGLIGN